MNEEQVMNRAIGSAKAHGLEKDEFFARLKKSGVVSVKGEYTPEQVVTACVAFLKTLNHNDCADVLQKEWNSTKVPPKSHVAPA